MDEVLVGRERPTKKKGKEEEGDNSKAKRSPLTNATKEPLSVNKVIA